MNEYSIAISGMEAIKAYRGGKRTPFSEAFASLTISEAIECRRQCAEVIGVDVDDLHRYSSGEISVNVSQIIKICRIFNQYGVLDPFKITI